jgi:hypothetical protein
MIRKAFWTMALENSAPAPALFNNIALRPITGWLPGRVSAPFHGI